MNKFNSDGVLIVSQLGGGGGGITNINVSAGTTSQNLSNIVFSNSNKFSFGLNGSTITAVYSGINALGVSNVGNTAGNTGVSTGIDWVIAGSNNITVQQSTVVGGPNTIWITGAAGGGGLTNINVSAGTTSNNLSNIVFSNSNNVSFGLNGSTITATVTVASTQGSINLSAGTTSNLASAFTFSNSNGVSFGLNASTITASIATSLTNIRVSAGTTSNLLSAITFSNANGITFGLDASTITASHNGLTSQSTDYHAITLGGNTAGTTTFHATDNRTIFLNGGANITLSGNGSTITIVGAAGGGAPTLSYYNNGLPVSTTEPSFGFLFVYPLQQGLIFPGNMSVSTMFLNYTGTVSTGAAWTRSVSIGFYTLVNSTQLSLAFSASTSWGTNAANMNVNDSFGGNRWVTFHSSQFNNAPNFSETHYWIAYWNRSSGGSQSFNLYCHQHLSATGIRSGFMSVVSNTDVSQKWLLFLGASSASFSTAMPDSLGASQLGRNFAGLERIPQVQFNNVGSNII